MCGTKINCTMCTCKTKGKWDTHVEGTCTLQFRSNNKHHSLNAQQFQILLTFFPKSFSHFPHGTCSLLVSNTCLAVDAIYHPICIPLPRNATLYDMPYTEHAHDKQEFHLLCCFPQKHTCATALAMSMQTTISNQWLTLSSEACPCSFAITKGILFGLLSSAYLYA